MSELTIQQILNSRFRTSKIADDTTKSLMEVLGLSTKANVARLCIGRSLALGPLPSENVDAKGIEINAQTLFTNEDVCIWVGMIITHALATNGKIIDSMDALRIAVRNHWHRGAALLIEDYKSCDEVFDKFLEMMITRRADLPDAVQTQEVDAVKAPPQQDKIYDISTALEEALKDIGVTSKVKGVTHGPRVSRYSVFLPDINHLTKLKKGLDRLSLVLALQYNIPTVAPGNEPKIVFLDIPRPKNSWISIGFEKLCEWTSGAIIGPDKLVVFPGVDVMGLPYSLDLASSVSPHLLVGGATGQGKSVCLHAIILSLMMQHRPETMCLALIDPKQVEFTVYEGNKYLWNGKIALGIEPARESLLELVGEMDKRYEIFKNIGVTNINEAHTNGLKLPYVVAFIEEMADLVLQDREIELHIVRLAQLARAAGIHLVLATQRPDSKTFSGLIRSNITARIALKVQKSSESTIIMDDIGAENLLGEGDMFVKTTGNPTRVHGVYVSRRDVEKFLRNN